MSSPSSTTAHRPRSRPPLARTRELEAIREQLAEKSRGPGNHLPFPASIELDSPTTAHAWSDDLRVKILRVKIEREGDPASWVITSLGRYDAARAGSRHTLKAREGV